MEALAEGFSIEHRSSRRSTMKRNTISRRSTVGELFSFFYPVSCQQEFAFRHLKQLSPTERRNRNSETVSAEGSNVSFFRFLHLVQDIVITNQQADTQYTPSTPPRRMSSLWTTKYLSHFPVLLRPIKDTET